MLNKVVNKGILFRCVTRLHRINFKKNDQLVKRLAFGSSVKPFLFNTICLTLGVARVFITTNNKSTMGAKNVTKDTLAKNAIFERLE